MAEKSTASYNEQLNDEGVLPFVKIEENPRRIKMFKGNRLLIPGALEIDAIMRSIPEGKIITTTQIRHHLAERHEADYTCPVTTNAYIKLCANASSERGYDPIPYWRTLMKEGQLLEKYPGGLSYQTAKLEEEGLLVIQKGKKFHVEYFDEKLFLL